MKWVIAIYAVMSVLTLITYAIDKRAAVRDRPRISERTLHVLEFFGGFPGAIAGQVVFRHKTRKVGFLAVTWAIVVVHVAGWVGYVVL